MTAEFSWGTITLAALPWAILPAAILWRLRRTSTLESASATLPDDPPMVSVIVPARDEARNIEACIRSILSSHWPQIEVIVVDDQSSDGTGGIARRVASSECA